MSPFYHSLFHGSLYVIYHVGYLISDAPISTLFCHPLFPGSHVYVICISHLGRTYLVQQQGAVCPGAEVVVLVANGRLKRGQGAVRLVPVDVLHGIRPGARQRAQGKTRCRGIL